MKKLIFVVVVCLLVLLFATHAFGQTDKFDGDCTGQETAGRCTSKPDELPVADSNPQVESENITPPVVNTFGGK